MSTLAKIGIRHAPLSNRIVLARFGKDPCVALDTKDAMNEFWQALVSYAFEMKMPAPGEGREISFGGGDEQFFLTITRIRPDMSIDEAIKTINRLGATLSPEETGNG